MIYCILERQNNTSGERDREEWLSGSKFIEWWLNDDVHEVGESEFLDSSIWEP